MAAEDAMTASYDLIELCAGTAAVSLAALGAPPFPASRIGGKAGYATAILGELGVAPGSASRVLLIEADSRMARILRALFGSRREWLAEEIERQADLDPRTTWEAARRRPDAVGDLLWLAGARGGIGGFKGAHKLRPNVDGFIPSRASLAGRVRAFAPFEGRAEVMRADASGVSAIAFEPTRVYVDPPYAGRQGYACRLAEAPEDLARRWAQAGHRVAVSEARPLTPIAVDLTGRRERQFRRSLTRDRSEWLSMF